MSTKTTKTTKSTKSTKSTKIDNIVAIDNAIKVINDVTNNIDIDNVDNDVEKIMNELSQIPTKPSLYDELSETVTTKNLCTIFGMTDGGKILRRTLRKSFKQPINHEHMESWVFNKQIHKESLFELIKIFGKKS